MQTPKTHLQEVLYTLITEGKVSIMEFPYLSGFRSRVSELKVDYQLQLMKVRRERKNKFGNSYTYVEHRLVDLSQAERIYRQLVGREE